MKKGSQAWNGLKNAGLVLDDPLFREEYDDAFAAAYMKTGSPKAAQVLALRGLMSAAQRRRVSEGLPGDSALGAFDPVGQELTLVEAAREKTPGPNGKIQTSVEVLGSLDRSPWDPAEKRVPGLRAKRDALARLRAFDRETTAIRKGSSIFAGMADKREAIENELAAIKEDLKEAFPEDEALISALQVTADTFSRQVLRPGEDIDFVLAPRRALDDLVERLNSGQPMSETVARDQKLFSGLESELGFRLRPTSDGSIAVIDPANRTVVAILPRSVARVIAERENDIIPVVRLVSRYAAGELGNADGMTPDQHFDDLAEGFVEVHRHPRGMTATTGRDQRDAALAARNLINAGTPPGIALAGVTAYLGPESLLTVDLVLEIVEVMMSVYAEVLSAAHAVEDAGKLIEAHERGDDEAVRRLAVIVLLDVAGAVPHAGKVVLGLRRNRGLTAWHLAVD